MLNWLINVIRWFDPALERTSAEKKLERAVKQIATRFNLIYVPAETVVGVKAPAVVRVGGQAICGVSPGINNQLPTNVLVALLRNHLTELPGLTECEYAVEPL